MFGNCIFSFGVFIVFQTVARSLPFSFLKKVSHRKPFSCAVCVGFWASFAFSNGIFYETVSLWSWERVAYAIAAAGFSWVAHGVVTGED